LKLNIHILAIAFLLNLAQVSSAQNNTRSISFDFYGNTIQFKLGESSIIDFTESLSGETIEAFYRKISQAGYEEAITTLLSYKERHKLNDWLYYQLIRRTAQQLSPKAENYHRYTLYKWFLLCKSGYDATLTISGNKILFYVQSDENIYNIPFRLRNSKQYVCLNYHDYGSIDFEKDKFSEVIIQVPDAKQGFSYKITRLPDFNASAYQEKEFHFTYYENNYEFKIKLNPQVKMIFANYPVVDYEFFFNIPLSKETYSSLIPVLKQNVKGMSTKNGVDYLMHFTRYAFLFEPDSKNFGDEKRLSPEQTLLYDHSDCEDRAALLFCLIKEIYNLPMIVLTFPRHVTIAVKFNKPVGKPVLYNGAEYSVCEPTPQKKDLRLGQLSPELRNSTYEVAYAYIPQNK
jgi:hypothetical protein